MNAARVDEGQSAEIEHQLFGTTGQARYARPAASLPARRDPTRPPKRSWSWCLGAPPESADLLRRGPTHRNARARSLPPPPRRLVVSWRERLLRKEALDHLPSVLRRLLGTPPAEPRAINLSTEQARFQTCDTTTSFRWLFRALKASCAPGGGRLSLSKRRTFIGKGENGPR